MLHALSSRKFPVHPDLPTATLSDDDDAAPNPITSYLCQWKFPKGHKEWNLHMSDAVFEKHDYQKQKKRKVTPIEDFDPKV